MPNFPTYYGPPLPKVLNLFDLRHYWLMFKWIYFQPSRLMHYLYNAAPELYQATGRRILTQVPRQPAHRNLYVMSLVLMITLAIGLSVIVSAMQGTTISWLGIAGGVAFGAVVGVVVDVVGGVAAGVAMGVAFGVAGGVAGAVGWGVAFGVAIGVAFGVAGGVVGGVAFGVGWGVAYGMVFGVSRGVGVGAGVGVVEGVAVGVGASRLLFYVFEWALARWQTRGRSEPIAHLPKHPAVWDELAVWSLPQAAELLADTLNQDFEQGLVIARLISRNPFQRWAVQHGLLDYIAQCQDGLDALYHLCHWPSSDDYLIPPRGFPRFSESPSVRYVLLGEITQVFVDGTGGRTETLEWLVWRLTRRLRRMTPTPLSRFSGMLYELYRDESELDEQAVAEIHLAERFAAAYEGVRAYPHGAEVADSFATMDAFLHITSIEDLATAHQQLGWIQSLAESLLRPAVIRTLTALGDVSREVVVFTQSTSPARQSAALNRANGALSELATFVQTYVLPPERVLLKRIIQHWQTIIAAEQGKLGQAALREMLPSERLAVGHVARESNVWQRPIESINNPYVVGDPVAPPLFVGRGDILARIASLWSTTANADSIILYGHRRMGKSSLLRNLDQAAPPGSVVAYVDLQGETSFVDSTADLLAGLVNRIYSAVRRALPDSGLVRPEADAFTTPARAQLLFDQFMEQVRDVLNGRRLILALDEFEAIDYAVRDHKIGRDIYTFLRARKQEPWLAFVLGGLHTLDEMSRDYQEPFYGSYTNIQVSYLSSDAAAKLIAGPTPDFDVNYEPVAIERIIAETGGQPYLIQLICRDALDHLNHELFDEHKEREVKILLADVEAVLGADFFQHGTVYFDGIWTQASDPTQRQLLCAMAQRDEAWTLADLETTTGLASNLLIDQLRWMERHDILQKIDADPPRWKFYVPLMRRWIKEMAA